MFFQTFHFSRFKPVFRKFIYLLLIFSVFWQAGALTTGALAAQAHTDESGYAGHTVLHWQDSDHHHHNDGSLHADDSRGSTEHMQAESVSNAPGLLAADVPALYSLRSSAPVAPGEPCFSSPCIDGLLRPPKAST